MGLKRIDTFMGGKTTCGHHGVQVQTQGFGRWPPAQQQAGPWDTLRYPGEGPFVCPSFLICFPNTSSLPLGSLILPPRGQAGTSVRLSSFPNLMSLFEVSPVTELASPEPSLCHCTKKFPLCQGRPMVFHLAWGNRWESFLFHGLAQMQSPQCSLADY